MTNVTSDVTDAPRVYGCRRPSSVLGDSYVLCGARIYTDSMRVPIRRNPRFYPSRRRGPRGCVDRPKLLDCICRTGSADSSDYTPTQPRLGSRTRDFLSLCLIVTF